MKQNKWYTSIWAIALFMYLFFPVGIVFLYLRLKDKYGKYMSSTKMLYWFGVCWGGLGLLFLVTTITEPEFISENLISGLVVFIVPGGICFHLGNKRNKKFEIYNKYIKYVNSRRSIEISNLCNLVNEDYDTTLKNLTEMISKDIIDAYIENDELITRNNIPSPDRIFYQHEIKKETKIVKCKSCGAKNTLIVGKTKECEYCGTILQ